VEFLGEKRSLKEESVYIKKYADVKESSSSIAENGPKEELLPFRGGVGHPEKEEAEKSFGGDSGGATNPGGAAKLRENGLSCGANSALHSK